MLFVNKNMKMKIVLFFVIYAFISNINLSDGLDPVALETGFDNHGVLAAFGDYNGDKLVDVFVISPLGMHCARVALFHETERLLSSNVVQKCIK